MTHDSYNEHEAALSPLGRTLKPALLALCRWGEDFAAGRNAAREASKPAGRVVT